MKNILIPIDFSPYSVSAARMGAFLARKTRATIHLLHIANIPAGWDKKPLHVRQENPVIESRLAAAEIKLRKFSRHRIFKGLTHATSIKGDVAYEQILAYAKSHQINLIVIGAHGAGETSGLFIGSTAQRVLRMAPCPVLSVKKNYTPKAIRMIIFASDFDENVTRAINTVKNLATNLKASIDLLYVNTPTRFKDSEMVTKQMNTEVHVQKQVKFNCMIYHDHDQATGVINYAKKSKAGMIAMVTNLRKRKAGYHLGVTETVLFHATVPVLSCAQ
jgi:nucleotide-binding universal stress UspA family protein